MKQVIRLVAVLLMLGGGALLAYVGFTAIRGQGAASTSPNWSSGQIKKGHDIAVRLSTPQRLQLPGRLKNARLPAAGSEPGVKIVISKIGVHAPIVETAPVSGVWDVADWSVGHLTTTPNPGAPGNMALSAHDDIKGEVFKRLGELGPGDRIEIHTRHAVYTYVVVNQQTVDPSDVAVLNPTKAPTVTLISCAPYWVDTQRLVVQAVLKSQSAV